MVNLPATRTPRFESAALAGLPEPVRRYFTHAISDGAVVPAGVRLTMAGRINVGRWLSFTAEQEFRGHAFVWSARAGLGRWKPVDVVDSYGDGAGSTEGKLFGRLRFMHADDENTARAAAGRAAAESLWVPGALLPGPGVFWRVESDELIVVRLDLAPERPVVTFRIGASGVVRSVSLLRWGNAGQKHFSYIPFGGEFHAERRFGDLTLPSEVSVGWWWGTPRYEPFFEATILDVEPLASEEARW